MQFSVSHLLKSSIGEERRYSFEEEERRYEELSGVVRGSVRLMRTHQAVLVRGQLEAGVTSTCSRCLAPFVQPVGFELAEEFFPKIDVSSGIRLEGPPEGSFEIDERHTLDLGEAVRQYAVMAAPMKPLCGEECAGFCSTCGADLNQGTCACAALATDSRWSKLAALKGALQDA